jgi:hypothetical protein
VEHGAHFLILYYPLLWRGWQELRALESTLEYGDHEPGLHTISTRGGERQRPLSPSTPVRGGHALAAAEARMVDSPLALLAARLQLADLEEPEVRTPPLPARVC